MVGIGSRTKMRQESGGGVQHVNNKGRLWLNAYTGAILSEEWFLKPENVIKKSKLS